MDDLAVLDTTIKTIQRVLEDRGLAAAGITAETVLLNSGLGIDSLDLATIVVQMTEATGRDPFAGGFIDFRTVGDLARLYAD
jgi:acyl carrier protein